MTGDCMHNYDSDGQCSFCGYDGPRSPAPAQQQTQGEYAIDVEWVRRATRDVMKAAIEEAATKIANEMADFVVETVKLGLRTAARNEKL